MTLFAIKILTGTNGAWFVSYPLLDCHFHIYFDYRYTWFRLTAHGGCCQSAEDAYSSMAPDSTFIFVGGPCCSTLDFLCFMVTFNYNFIYLYSTMTCVKLQKSMLLLKNPWWHSPSPSNNLSINLGPPNQFLPSKASEVHELNTPKYKTAFNFAADYSPIIREETFGTT
jgi:hypothetical protein